MRSSILRKISLALLKQINDLRVCKSANWLLLAACTVPTGEVQAVSDSDWVEATKKVVRLQPNQFPFLSKPVVTKLEQLGCAIPQHWFSSEPNNVVIGQFLKRGQTDVALLCEQGHITTLLVLPNMGNGTPIPLVASSVQNYLQGVGENQIGFSWGISKISMSRVMQTWGGSNCKWRSAYAPQGIEDAFIDKYFTVRYRAKNSWQECQGAE